MVTVQRYDDARFVRELYARIVRDDELSETERAFLRSLYQIALFCYLNNIPVPAEVIILYDDFCLYGLDTDCVEFDD